MKRLALALSLLLTASAHTASAAPEASPAAAPSDAAPSDATPRAAKPQRKPNAKRQADAKQRPNAKRQAGAKKARAPDPHAKGRQAAVEALVRRAKSAKLADDLMWRRLLRYRGTLFGGVRSEADGKHFFLAADGKTNPEAELEATLRAFFDPHWSSPISDLEHPYCRFPARLAWLNARLGFDFSQLPRRECPRFQEFVLRLDADALVLVFSSYYLNNPASAFGHTFLRVNKRHRGGARGGVELLDYGIDYAAIADTSNALIYGIRGLTGLFPGVFSQIPYYVKVREYNDYESRDLWEYELDLSRAELSMVIAHLWEMGFNHFDYFYLSENCSYHILGLLEVASPRLNLLSRVGWPVIPADTVKAAYHQPGLVRRVHYRPSNRSQFHARLDSLTSDERDVLARLMADASAPFPAEYDEARQAKVLDVALDLFDFQLARDLVRAPGEEGDRIGAERKHQLLERRAALLIESEEHVMDPPLSKMPHRGHGSTRLGLGSGYQTERGYQHRLNLRLALHDLADPSAGYPDFAAIEFLPLELRYQVENPSVSLEHLSLVKITSLSPLGRFQGGWSWALNVGARRTYDAGCDGCLSGVLQFGAGFAVAPFGDALTTWVLADARLLAPVDRDGLFDWLRAGIGPTGGLRLRLTEDLALLGAGELSYLPAQEPHFTWRGDGTLRWQLVRDFALSLEGSLSPESRSAHAMSLMYF
ncbi:MAG: DUF4105 domain-containing protein [Polyangiaceae bacterium]|nr:DUF4105 domain-containing protein [Polyangiaceae bacterium]MCW5791965.1 DUF4105 domain-containing protein [Polyangiaceae bacterium]